MDGHNSTNSYSSKEQENTSTKRSASGQSFKPENRQGNSSKVVFELGAHSSEDEDENSIRARDSKNPKSSHQEIPNVSLNSPPIAVLAAIFPPLFYQIG